MEELQVRDIMTTEVVAVPATTPVADVAILLHERQITGVPIVGGEGRVVGVVSEIDVLDRQGGTAGDIMTREVISVAPETPLDEVVRLLTDRRIRRVPVLDGGRLVGLVSRADLLRLFTRTRWTCERCGHFVRGLSRPVRCDRCGAGQMVLQRDAHGY